MTAVTRLVTCLIVLVGFTPLAADAAHAHGPCGCTSPTHGTPGERLTIEDTSAVEVVWNPTPESLRIGAFPDIEHDHVGDVASPVLFKSASRERGVVVAIPDVPPGRYLMVIYDGSEGGDHYTWDHVRVAANPDDTLAPVDRPDDGSWLLPAAGAGLVIAALSIAVYRRRAAR